MDRAGLLEMIAGKTRSNTAAAILSNTKDLEDAYKSAMDAEGSAYAENEKYLDSIQGRIDLFNNAIQTMWNNTLGSDVVKDFVDIGTGLVKIVDQLGLVKTLVVAIGTYLIQKHFKGDLFGGMFGEKIDDMKTRLKSLKDEFRKVQFDAISNPSKENNKKLGKAKKRYEKYDEKVSPYIKQYDELSEKLKEQRAATENAKKELYSYNDTLKEKSVLTQEDIAQQDILKGKLESANQEVVKTEAELKKVEMQANAAGTSGLVAGQKIKTGFGQAWKSVKKFGKEMLKSMAWSMAITAVLESITIIGEWIGDAWNYFKPKTFEDLQEELEQTKSELSNVESEIRSLNTELDDVNERIEELMNQGSLTYVEQEELNKLKATTEELKAQITLNETLKKTKQTTANSQSIDATNSYLDTSFMSDQTRTERQEEWGETGEEIGNVIGTVGGAAFGAKVLGSIGAIGGPLGVAIGIAAGAAIGGLVGTFIGEGLAGVAYDSEETVGEAMDNMIAKRKELKEIQNKAIADKDTEAYNDATEALNTYDAQMAKHITQIQENYNAMDWESAEPEQKQYMKDMADWLDKYSINMGVDGAESSAIARLFGPEASNDVKQLKSDIEDAMKAAKADGVETTFDFQEAFNSDKLSEFRDRLYNLGLTVTDVKYYFLDLAKAEQEAEDSYSTYDTVKEINSLSDGVKSLKDAFGEIQEAGYVSTETLVALEEKFGGLKESWINFVDTVATGTSSIQEATEAINELLEAYLTQQLAKGPMSAEEKLKTIMLLQQLGVKNAKEYMDAMEKASMVGEVAQSYTSDQERIAELEAKKKKNGGEGRTKEEIEEQEKLEAKTQDINNYIKEVEGTYQIDLTPDEEQLLIQKAITAEKAKQNALAMQEKKAAYDAAKKKYDEALEKNKNIDDKIEKLSGTNYAYDQSWLDEYNVTENTTSSGRTLSYSYNGKSYETLLELRDAIKQDLEAKKVEVPELPIEITDTHVKNANDVAESTQNDLEQAFDEMGLSVDVKLEDFDTKIDQIQDAYSTLNNVVEEYNSKGYLTLDNLQALLNLQPEYLACLQMENGQLSINQSAMEAMIQTRLADAKAEVIQNAITKLNALANREAADAINNNNIAASNAIGGLGAYANALDVVAQDAIIAAGSVIALNNAMAGAQANELVSQEEIDSILYNMNTQLTMIDSLGANLSSNFSSIVSGDSGGSADDAFQKAMDYWENRIGANQARYEQIQNEIDLLEKQGKTAGKEYYEEQIRLENERLELLEAQKAEAQKFLGTFREGSEEWWSVAETLNSLEGEIDDVTSSIQDLSDAIAEVDWYIFDEAHERYSTLIDDLDTIRDLISPNGEEDWFDDEGMWTEKGVASLATYIQQLEMYGNTYDEVTKKLNEEYSLPYAGNEEYYKNLGIDSEQELYDIREKLMDQQQEALKGASDSQQSIVDMYESQIDAVEEWANEAIESYNDYIDVVKEALDAERDLYEFKKDVEKQTKDIASLERRIASLSGSTNAADIAERRKLEAELYEAREGLNDTYYDHAKDSQQQALDDEATAYEKSMNKFIEGLRKGLESALLDMDLFMQGVFSAVTANAPAILEQFNALGLSLDGAIIDPWKEAANAIVEFGGVDGLGMMNAWIAESGIFPTFQSNATTSLTSPWTAGQNAANTFKTSVFDSMSQVVSNITTNVATAKSQLSSLYSQIQDTDTRLASVGSGGGGGGGGGGATMSTSDISALQTVLKNMFYQVVSVDGKWGPETEKALKGAQLVMKNAGISVNADGRYTAATKNAMIAYIDKEINKLKSYGGSSIYGQAIQKFTGYKNMLPAAFHAKGTLGTKRDELAITDESWIGEEITLAAGKNGQLQYLKKGSAVMPADISANLVEWGKLNPQSMNIGGTPNINMISNAVNKPEFKIDVENFLRCDNVSQDTLPELKRFVNEQMHSLMKQLNYGLKKAGAR